MPRSTPHPHSYASNPRYILRRQMQIDGQWRLPGDEVPEAAEWRNLYSYLDLGWIEALDDDEDDVPTMSASRPQERKARLAAEAAAAAATAPKPDVKSSGDASSEDTTKDQLDEG